MIERKIKPPKPNGKSVKTWTVIGLDTPLSVYHGSFDVGGPAPVFSVRDPDPDRGTHGEDVETPRISCATNLLDVIAAGYFWSPRNQDVLSKEVQHPVNIYALTAKSYTVPSLQQVPDAVMSGEVWVTDDSELKQEHCAVVRVTKHYSLQDLLGTKRSGWDYLFLDLEIVVLTQMQFDRNTLLTPGKYVVSVTRSIDSDAPWATEINKLADSLCDFITTPPYMVKSFDMVDTIVDVLLEDLATHFDNELPATETNFLVDLNRFSTVALNLVLANMDQIKETTLTASFESFIREVVGGMVLCNWHRVDRNRRTYYVLTARPGIADQNKGIPKWQSNYWTRSRKDKLPR